MLVSMKTPVKNKILAGGTLLMLAAQAVLGQDASTDNAAGYYKACEFSLDAFGTASVGEYTIDHVSGDRIRRNTRLGAGIGGNYFFTRNFGVGAEVYSENTTGTWVDSGSADFIARLPLGDSGFAPYVIGGGGRHFEQVKTWFAEAGAGMEYRFTPHWGLFADARGVLPNETRFYGVARMGLRFAF